LLFWLDLPGVVVVVLMLLLLVVLLFAEPELELELEPVQDPALTRTTVDLPWTCGSGGDRWW
jgi:hypothetical protein